MVHLPMTVDALTLFGRLEDLEVHSSTPNIQGDTCRALQVKCEDEDKRTRGG